MRTNRSNLKKLASLSALGAGAVCLTAAKAKASVVYVPVNAGVGFDSGFSSSYNSAALPSSLPSTLLSFFRTSVGSRSSGARDVFGGGNNPALKFGGYSLSGFKVLSTFGPGAKWGSPTAFPQVLIGGRSWGFSETSTGSSYSGGGGAGGGAAQFVTGHNSFEDVYGLFQYQSSLGPLYGWVELSLTVDPAYGYGSGNGPDVTIIAYAVDTSGAQIAAGDETSVPEPSAFELSGLGALALGSVGIRRWRAARKRVQIASGA